jgi:hypothetical protein
MSRARDGRRHHLGDIRELGNHLPGGIIGSVQDECRQTRSAVVAIATACGILCVGYTERLLRGLEMGGC